MKLSLHPTELKVFIRCINCLAKLGNEIYFNWESDGLSLKTVNPPRSAYAAVTFKTIFFEKASSNENSVRFKIASRSCCNVFKVSSSLERAVHKCRILLTSGDTLLVVQYFCKYGIVKTFNMSIIDCEHLEAVYSLEQSANHLVLSTRVLMEVLNNFRQSSEEMTVILKEGECTFQNYILHGDPNSILTQLPLSANEFDAYLVGCSGELTFCQKELRALLTFCELVSPVLRIYCDRPGKPVIFACAHETRLSARFVLATLPSDAYSAPVSQQSQSAQRTILASKTPVQVRRIPRQQADQSAPTLSRPVFPDFDEDPNDEVTLLATLPSDTTRPIVVADSQSRDALVPIVDQNLLHTQPVNSVPSPLAPPRPFNIPRICQSMASSIAPTDSASNAPFKKARSALFSFIEHSEDTDNLTAEDLDMELQQLTRPYADLSTAQRSAPNLNRTVLVADSDEEN